MSCSIIKFSALCALLCSLVSCAALEKLVTAPAYAPIEEQLTDEWYGRADTDIVLAYGTPNRVIDDGLGGFMSMRRFILNLRLRAIAGHWFTAPIRSSIWTPKRLATMCARIALRRTAVDSVPCAPSAPPQSLPDWYMP